MQRRIAILIVLAGAAALLAACGPTVAPAGATQPAATLGVRYRMVPVKTATSVGWVATAAPTRPPATAAPTARQTAGTATPNPQDAVVRVEVADAKNKLDAGTAVLVDVRAAASYAKGHAQGALSFPETEMPARYTELPKDKLIILYCT